MPTLTAQEFLNITKRNPHWAKTLTERLTITGKMTLPENHPLTTLNPKLIFKDHANFRESQITIAEGVFHHGVDFSGSKIQEIGELTILGTDQEGNAARFCNCKALRIAKGTFPGFANFDSSGIRKIADDLRITVPNRCGNAASFYKCTRLTVARGTFAGWVNFSFSGIRKIADTLRVTTPSVEGYSADFRYCHHLHIASGTFCGTVDFTETPITRAHNLEITVWKGKPKAVFTKLCLEESPFPLEEITIPDSFKEELRRKTIQKLNNRLKTCFPQIPQTIQDSYQNDNAHC